MAKDETRDIGGRKVRLTNLNKVFWPDEGYTKGDLIDYYLGVAELILPYLKDRPQSLDRFPNGITGEDFYQKDIAGQAPDWAETVKIHSDSGDKDIEYVLCQDEASLAYLINLGCIDLNPWNSRVGALDKPDYLIIDLDPEDIGFEKVVEAANATRSVLEAAGMPGYPKTSGKTGIHIYVPMGAKYSYDQVRQMALILVTLVHHRIPDFTSLERSPAKRQGCVYLDWLQNRRGQTLAAPYCVRPVGGANVSAPLKWEELTRDLSPSAFNIRNIQQRVDKVGDLWQPVSAEPADIEAALARLEKLAD